MRYSCEASPMKHGAREVDSPLPTIPTCAFQARSGSRGRRGKRGTSIVGYAGSGSSDRVLCDRSKDRAVA